MPSPFSFDASVGEFRCAVPFSRRLVNAALVILAVAPVLGCGDGPRSAAGKKTLAYWQSLIESKNAVIKAVQSKGATAATYSSAANKVRALPTLDVDEQAVTFALKLGQWYQAMAAHRSAVDSPAMMVESFIRGANGDPFGTVQDAMANESALNSSLQRLDQQSAVVRALLTAKYKFEFPSF
jgi:hypothetical protein